MYSSNKRNHYDCQFSIICVFVFSQVDKHIRKLDAELARFEADIKDKSSGRQKDSPEGKANAKKSMLSMFMINHIVLIV